MSLVQAFRDAGEFTETIRRRAAHPIQTGMAMGAGGIPGLGYVPGGVSLAHHIEQYKHFNGFPYTLINTIARRIAGQTLHVARMMEKQQRAWRQPNKASLPPFARDASENMRVLTEHLMLNVMKRPNPLMTHSALFLVTVASMELTGKAYWWMYDDPEQGEQIWPIPSSWIEPVHEADKLYAFWKVTPFGQVEPSMIPVEDIAYFYHPEPSSPLDAKAPLQALARSVLADENVEECQRRAFANGIKPGVALIVGKLPGTAGVQQAGKPVLTQVQRQQLITQVKKQYRGVLNYDEPLILDGFIEDVKRIDSTAREMDFLNSGQATQKRLAKGWGVSEVSLGEMMGANRASAAVADDHLVLNTINPRITLISEVMTIWAAPRYAKGGEKLCAYLEKAHSTDRELQLNQVGQMLDRGVINRNEARAQVFDLPPIKDGHLAYVNGQPVPVEQEDRGRGTAPAQRSIRPVPRSSGVYAPGVWLKFWTKAERKYEATMSLAVLGVVRGMREEFVIEVRRLAAGAPVTSETVRRALDARRWAQRASEAVRGVAYEAALFAAASELNLGGVARIPGAVASLVSTVASEVSAIPRWLDFVSNMRDSLWDHIKRAYQAGEAAGRAVSLAVRDVLGEPVAASAARQAAVTETIAALNGGQFSAQQHLGRVGKIKRRQWRTTRKQNVRPVHKAMEGQTVDYDQPFDMAGHDCWYPGDPSLPAEYRCNCQCSTVSIA